MNILPDSGEEAEISMSPLIDCVFLLLIFFLVSTMSKKENRDIDIEPPQSISAEREIPDDDALVIGIDRGGLLYLQGEETGLNQLHARLRDLSLTNPEQAIRLDADHLTPLHRVVEVLDLCQFNQLGNVNIRTYDESYNRK
jgi:biopolymer transport protein ExbD